MVQRYLPIENFWDWYVPRMYKKNTGLCFSVFFHRHTCENSFLWLEPSQSFWNKLSCERFIFAWHAVHVQEVSLHKLSMISSHAWFKFSNTIFACCQNKSQLDGHMEKSSNQKIETRAQTKIRKHYACPTLKFHTWSNWWTKQRQRQDTASQGQKLSTLLWLMWSLVRKSSNISMLK